MGTLNEDDLWISLGEDLRTGRMSACAVSPDGSLAVTASIEDTLRIWHVRSGRMLAVLEGHVGPVIACAVTADGRSVISASRDGSLKVWSLESHRPLITVECNVTLPRVCAVTTDGRRAIVAFAHVDLGIWDLEHGRMLGVLAGHTSDVTACAVTADGQRAISASEDKTLKVWDLERGVLLATLEGHEGGVHACAVTVDGRVVSASEDRTLRIWALDSGRLLATLEGHEGGVHACAVSANRHMVSASQDGTLRGWDLDTGACSFVYHSSTTYDAIAATSTATSLVAIDNDGVVWFLDKAGDGFRSAVYPEDPGGDDPRSGAYMFRRGSSDHEPRRSGVAGPLDWHLDGGDSRRFLRWTPEVARVVRVGLGLLYAAREALPFATLVELAGWSDGEERWLCVARAMLVVEPGEWVVDDEYRPNDEGVRFAEQLGAATLRTHHATLAHGLATWPPPPPGPAARRYDLRYTLRHALTHRAEADAWMEAWRLATNLGFLEAQCRELGPHEAEAEVARLADRCRERGNEALGRRFENLARALARETHGLREAPEATAALVWNRLRRSGWSAHELDEELRIPVEARFVRIRHEAPPSDARLAPDRAGHARAVRACAASVDGRCAVTASEDRTLKVWDPVRGRALATLEGHADWVNACAVTADGRRIVSASEDRTLKLWDADGGRVLGTLAGHAGPVKGCAVTADGGRIVSASEDRTLIIWAADGGRELVTLTGHAGRVNACAVTADSRLVVSASEDWTLKLWDTDSGRVLATLAGHAGRVNACALVPDGRRALSASSDGTLKIWDLERACEIGTLAGHAGDVPACAVTADGRRAVSVSADRTLKIWDLDTGACRFTHRGDAAFTAVAVTEAVIVAGDVGGAVWFLDWPPSKRLQELRSLAQTDWDDPGPVLRVLDGLMRSPAPTSGELGLEEIQRLSTRPSLRESLAIAEYLASKRVGLLAAQFQINRGDGGLQELSDAAVYDALRTGVLRDPRSGDAIDDWPRRVVLSYRSLAAGAAEPG